MPRCGVQREGWRKPNHRVGLRGLTQAHPWLWEGQGRQPGRTDKGGLSSMGTLHPGRPPGKRELTTGAPAAGGGKRDAGSAYRSCKSG